MNKSKFISTAIPYVNSKPHLGHALEYVQADAYARFLRESKYEVFFLTGTDDNALKNVQAAEKAGKEVSDYVNENAQRFIELDKKLGISYDDFIRTSVDIRHREGAQKLWQMTNRDDLYLKAYRGFYCTGCEEFKTEKELVNGECPEHPGAQLEEVEEENYFFRLSKYQDELERLIETDNIKVIPVSRKHEALAFVRSGLQDFSVSRSSKRAKGWGIPVPGNSDQYLYVWYDALANYITALGYSDGGDDYRKFWTDASERIHLIGKGINRFHTIYWPAMLLSAGLPLPTTIFIHGYITSEGQKMSKSIGNVIDPNDLLDKYGSDATRYLLLRHVHATEDTDITWDRLDEWYTANLVNGLGNLVSRVMKLSETHASRQESLKTDFSLVRDIAALEKTPIGALHMRFGDVMENFEFHRAMNIIWAYMQDLDERITKEEPFKLVKLDRERGVELIQELVREVFKIGLLLLPLMPETSAVITKSVIENKKPENLFPRLG